MARDCLGVKPLYYSDTPGCLVFGSEIKALLAHPQISADLEVARSARRDQQRRAAVPRCRSHIDRAARYRDDMADRNDKVTVQLDAEMVERARAELAFDSGSDTAVVERALNAYLMGRLLDVTQARAGLSEDEATRLSYEELHAARRERGAA